jgi:CRP/FNR family transcriptional regulator, cyclic AMP receptor protein
MEGPMRSGDHLAVDDHEFMWLLSAAEREELLKHARPHRLNAGQVLFQKGDPGDKLFIIGSGLVEIGVDTEDGKHLVFNVLGPGDVFGEIALLDGGPRTADATVMASSELQVIDRSEVILFLEHHPEMTARLIAVLCKRIRWISQNLEDALGSDVTHRLARKLVNLCKAYGTNAGDGSTGIELKLPQQELANMIGVTRESVNKHLKKWQNLGWISIKRGQLTISDIDQLTTMAEAAD